MAISVVYFAFSWCSTGGPGAHSAGFLYYILLATSLDPKSSGVPRAPSAWCGLPYHISSITRLMSNCLTSVLTELYNSSTSTQSPTRSLDWHVWSSSSGNNCHAVHRSLSSGASLCSGTVGPSPCSILSAIIRSRDLFRLLAIGMCNFLPVHHFEWHFWSGRRPKYNNLGWIILLQFFNKDGFGINSPAKIYRKIKEINWTFSSIKSLGKCKVLLHCHRPQLYSGTEW